VAGPRVEQEEDATHKRDETFDLTLVAEKTVTVTESTRPTPPQ
jgi:hypothetical protein